MSATDLSFELEDLIEGLRKWVEIESPTFDAVAVERMADHAAFELAKAGAKVERIHGRDGLGGSVLARFPHPRAGEQGIMFSGHLDTVHPLGSLKKNPWRREDGKLYGPGVHDMKGGIFLAIEAMRRLKEAGIETALPVTFLLTPDEEIGSPTSRDLIEAEARKNKYVIVGEPCLSDNAAVIGRYAIARFNLQTRGRPSHAGWALKEGRSAISEMARRIPEIEGMTTEDTTYSVGVIAAGEWVNCVPATCNAELLSMAKTQEYLDHGVDALMKLQGIRNDVEFIVNRGCWRPVWSPGQAEDLALFDLARPIAARAGIDLRHEPSGGGSDGNFTGALGIATLDSTGPRGAGLHTLQEFVFEDSLIERARFHAGLFAELA